MNKMKIKSLLLNDIHCNILLFDMYVLLSPFKIKAPSVV